MTQSRSRAAPLGLAFFFAALCALTATFTGSDAYAGSPGVKINVNLSPTGAFEITCDKLQGHLSRKGDKLVGQNIVIPLKELKSGIKLRDDHIQKHFDTSTPGHETAVLKKAVGKDGNFVGILRIRNKDQKIKGTYIEESGFVRASFTASNASFDLPSAKYMGVGVNDQVSVEALVPVR